MSFHGKYQKYKNKYLNLKKCQNNGLMTIKFDSKILINEMELSEVQNEPKLVINGSNNYTLIMVDPDAPSRENPINKYWLHWMFINSDQVIVPFQPPSPPKKSGKHRYYFYLFEQPKHFDVNEFKNKYIGGGHFNLINFIKDNNLKLVS